MRKFMVTLLVAAFLAGGAVSVVSAGSLSLETSSLATAMGRYGMPKGAAWEAGVASGEVEKIARRPYSRGYRSGDRYSRRYGSRRYRGPNRPYYLDRYGRRYYGYPGDYRDYGRYSRKYRSQPRFRIWIPGYWTSHGYINGYWTFRWTDRRRDRHDLYEDDCRYRC